MICISTLFIASLVFNTATVLGAPVRITPGSASEAVPRAITVLDTPVARANIVEVPVQRRSTLGRLTRRTARLDTRQEEEDINLPRGFVDVTPEPQQQKRHHSNEQPEAEVVRRFPRRVYAEYYGKREPSTKIKETTIVIEKTTIHDTPYDAMAANMHKSVSHVSNVNNVNNVHSTTNHNNVMQAPPASQYMAGGMPPDMLAMVLSGQMGTVMSMSQTTTIQNYQPGATPPPMMGMGMGMGGMGMYADKNGMVMAGTAVAAYPPAATADPNAAAAASVTDAAAAAAATPDASADVVDPLANADDAADPAAAAVDPTADPALAASPPAVVDPAADPAAASASVDPAAAAAATPPAAAAATPSDAAAVAAAATPAVVADPAAVTPPAAVVGAEAAAATATATVDPLAPAATPPAADAAAPPAAAVVTPPAAAEAAPPVAAVVTSPAAKESPPAAAAAPPAAEVAAPPVTPLPAGTPPSVTARSNGNTKGVIISREPVLDSPEVRAAKPSTESISRRSLSYSGASWASAVRRGFKA